MMKAYTDIEQSKKLAEFLPLESADMCYKAYGERQVAVCPYQLASLIGVLPCWSLAALLDILDYPQLSKDKIGSGKTGWMVSVYPNDCRYDSCLHDNPIDACVEMILKLHKEKLL